MKLEEYLYRWFGYSEFRQVKRSHYRFIGRKRCYSDASDRKGSLCAINFGLMQEGTVLVVSPLLSLMEDQVTQLKYVVKNRVIAFNSFRTLQEKRSDEKISFL